VRGFDFGQSVEQPLPARGEPAAPRAHAPARHVGDARALLVDDAEPGDLQAGIDAEDPHASSKDAVV
jgi:hypothetical protein